MTQGRYFKLTMENGSEQIIRAEMSMLDLGNELRNKAKINVKDPDGKDIQLKSADVHSIEHYRPTKPVER